MLKKIVSIIITVILGISILLCCATIVKSALGMEKSLFGLRVFYLVSGSMEPTIPTGAAVLVHKSADYEINDVITFESADSAISGFPNTHRIIDCKEVNGQKVYVTKGDANPVADETVVTEKAIYGKVVCHTGKLKWLGTLIGMLTTPLGFITVIILPILAIIAVLMRNFTKEYKAALAAEAVGTIGAVTQIPASKAEPITAAEASPEPEETTEPEPEETTEPEPEEVTEPESGETTEPEPEATTEPEPEEVAEPESETQSDTSE